MKKFCGKITHPIAVEDEISALLSFIEATWKTDGLVLAESKNRPIEALLSAAFTAGYEANASAVLSEAVTRLTGKSLADRDQQLKASLSDDHPGVKFDGLHSFLREIRFAHVLGAPFAKVINVDIEREIKRLLHDEFSDIKGIDSLRPKGYGDFTEGYKDYDGMESFDFDTNESAFTGHDYGNSAMGSLPTCSSLPYIAYDDIEQDRAPDLRLLGLVFYQGMSIRSYNNAVILGQELAQLSGAELSFINKAVVPGSEYPLINTVFKEAIKEHAENFEPLTEDRIEKIKVSRTEWQALEEKEKNRIMAKNYAAIISSLNKVGGPSGP
jgi:hypothetical protein